MLVFSLSLTTPSQPRCGLEAQAEGQVFASEGGSGANRVTDNAGERYEVVEAGP